MFKVNNKNTSSGIFIINFEHISLLFVVFFFVVDFEQVNVRWDDVSLCFTLSYETADMIEIKQSS